jgi:C4-dicarboxylate transporter DctM subunit
VASVATLEFASSLPLTLAAQRLFTGADSFPLMAIPFFMLAGELMESGGISRRLFDFAHALVGFVAGGLAMVAVVAAMFLPVSRVRPPPIPPPWARCPFRP